MRLYHGSDVVVKQPLYGYGKEDNDYGKGFYATEEREKANAWAVVNGTDSAYCNIYDIDLTDLEILYLDKYGVLAWVSEVIAHRGIIDEDVFYTAQALVDQYKIDTEQYDVIIGYRADDSYTRVIDAFLKNQLTVDEMERFFHKRNLGEQVFIKSKRAFGKLNFVGFEKVVEKERYAGYDIAARREVENFLNNRFRAIQVENYQPQGLTVREVIHTQYEYNTEYNFYQPCYVEKEREFDDDWER